VRLSVKVVRERRILMVSPRRGISLQFDLCLPSRRDDKTDKEVSFVTRRFFLHGFFASIERGPAVGIEGKRVVIAARGF
jgi:hypothetical protein